jgi:hypothetical protein
MKYLAYVLAVSAMLLNIAAPNALAEEGSPPQTGALGAAISDAQLSTNRGGHTLELNTNNLTGSAYDNQAIANVTGSNAISTGALAGAAGMPMVIQNSGNNVLIQNATILNVKLQ